MVYDRPSSRHDRNTGFWLCAYVPGFLARKAYGAMRDMTSSYATKHVAACYIIRSRPLGSL